MNIYLTIITTVLVLTQIVRITQNHFQLKNQAKSIETELKHLESYSDKGMKLHEIIDNRYFDVNADYKVYLGVWDDGGELLWMSRTDGKLSVDDAISQYDVSYITVDVDTREIVIEVS